MSITHHRRLYLLVFFPLLWVLHKNKKKYTIEYSEKKNILNTIDFLAHEYSRHSPTAGTTPAAITYGTHKDSSRTEMTGAASLRMMNWRSMLRMPFA